MNEKSRTPKITQHSDILADYVARPSYKNPFTLQVVERDGAKYLEMGVPNVSALEVMEKIIHMCACNQWRIMHGCQAKNEQTQLLSSYPIRLTTEIWPEKRRERWEYTGVPLDTCSLYDLQSQTPLIFLHLQLQRTCIQQKFSEIDPKVRITSSKNEHIFVRDSPWCNMFHYLVWSRNCILYCPRAGKRVSQLYLNADGSQRYLYRYEDDHISPKNL